jgi:3-phenylpropionate/trans-cinnamate dioxygenase ferredoxin subunit
MAIKKKASITPKGLNFQEVYRLVPSMTEKKYTWHKLADNIEELKFSNSGLSELEIAGKKICISLYKDKLHACLAKCPHASGNLAEGFIDALGNVVCPIHRYRFSLQNGHNSSGEGYYLKTYPIENRAEGIFIGIESTGLLNRLK